LFFYWFGELKSHIKIIAPLIKPENKFLNRIVDIVERGRSSDYSKSRNASWMMTPDIYIIHNDGYGIFAQQATLYTCTSYCINKHIYH
jgi:hypothetical protein